MPADAAQSAAQNRERGVRQSGGAHFFRDAIDELGADGARRFRGDIARGMPVPPVVTINRTCSASRSSAASITG